MSIVAGTKRKDTCSNVVGGLKSITMNPPTPPSNTAKRIIKLAPVKPPSMPLGVVLVLMLMVFEVLNGFY